MAKRDQVLSRFTSGAFPDNRVVGVLVTGIAIVAVLVGLGLLAIAIYDVLPQQLEFTGLLGALVILGFGGLYVVTRVMDRVR